VWFWSAFPLWLGMVSIFSCFLAILTSWKKCWNTSFQCRKWFYVNNSCLLCSEIPKMGVFKQSFIFSCLQYYTELWHRVFWRSVIPCIWGKMVRDKKFHSRFIVKFNIIIFTMPLQRDISYIVFSFLFAQKTLLSLTLHHSQKLPYGRSAF
jgi:hypothetical protein